MNTNRSVVRKTRSTLWKRAVLLVYLAWGVAHAADTVITFDDLPADTWLASQYHAQGVDFGYPPYSSLPPSRQIPAIVCCAPIIKAAPTGHASQVAFISGGHEEVFQPNMFGTFTSFHYRVQVTVGNYLNETSVVSLKAYDIDGMLVAQSAEQTITGSTQTVTLTAAEGGSTPTIAYFLVSATHDTYPWADDLTFDNPSTAAKPDFTLGLASGGNFFSVAQGDFANETIAINRFNGSNGNITFSASGLPAGVTATFSPNPVSGSGASTTLSLYAANNAPPITNATFTITADPQGNSAVGPQARTSQLPINVSPAFTISSPSGVTYSLAPCTPLQISIIYVNKNSSIIGDVTLALRAAGPNGNTAPLPSYIQAAFTPPVSTGLSTMHTLTISIPAGSLTSSQSVDLVVQGTSGQYTEVAQPFTIKGIADGNGIIDYVVPTSGSTPQAMRPGTQVFIKGQGFCSPFQVQFGNAKAVVYPDTVTPTGIKATVPALATSGRITLVPQNLSSPSPFVVDSFRNTAGFSFHTYIPDITYGQYTEAFGEDQTYDSIDLCWPFGCTISLPDPIAWLIYHFLSGYLGDPNGGGACVGFALASQRLLEGQRSRGDFPPPGAPDNFALATPNAPSGPITDYINSLSMEQVSIQFLSQWLGNHISQRDESVQDALAQIRSSIQGAFSNGETPLIALWGSGSTGHVVVAYDLEDTGPNAFKIYVYDSNLPFADYEDSDGSGGTHAKAREQSAIVVTPDSNWTLQSTQLNGSPMTGDRSGLIVIRASSIPVKPTLPGAAQIFNNPIILFGGSSAGSSTASRTTQLADGAGHTLFDAGGKLNANPSTSLQAAPFPAFTGMGQAPESFLISPNAGAVNLTVAGTASGPDAHGFVAPNFVARFDTQAVPGISDHISFDPAGTASFRTEGTSKPLTVGIIKAANGTFQTAQLTTTGFQGATEGLRFDQTGNTLTFQHSGPASFRLQLTSRGKSTTNISGSAPQPVGPIFDSGMLQASAGAMITFSAADWSRLDTVAMTVRDPQGHEVRQTLQNQTQTMPLGQITAVAALHNSTVPNALQLRASAQIEQIPSNAQVTLSWTVSDASGKILEHNNQTLLAADVTPGEHTYSWSPSTMDPGTYTARASLAIVTGDGVLQAGQASSGSTTFSVEQPPEKCQGVCK